MKTLKIVLLLLLFITSLQAENIQLIVKEKKIKVNGKETVVYSLAQPDGTPGAVFNKGDTFSVSLQNKLSVPTSVHWHGVILPNKEDGVAFVTQMPIYPGLEYEYKYPILQAGTFWMHSHFSLQEQLLFTAPLIFKDADDSKLADRDVVVMLNDFSFTPPEKIFEQLRSMKMGGIMKGGPDINDVDYDAFLANERTIDDPDIVEVKVGEKVRLRIINGSSASNFFITTDKLPSEAIAVDGNRIEHYSDEVYELADAQRIDIIVTIPNEGVFPILASAAGTAKQTGIVLKTAGAEVPQYLQTTGRVAGALTNKQEEKLKALHPLSKRAVDRKVELVLGGDMMTYQWTINGQSWPMVTPVIVKKGERVEITFKNETTMSHPMHLHGHIFQVTAIDGKPIDGAVRDTVLVMPKQSLSIQFDADNPGAWPLHCHILYHMEAGMFTVLRYDGFQQPL